MSINNSTFNIPEWSSVITAVSIPSTIAVYGNGKAIGVISNENGPNGTKLIYSTKRTGTASAFGINVGDYKSTNLPYTNSGTPDTTGMAQHQAIGLTTDTSGKSGIVAKSNSITRTSKSFNFCIKY